jgi:hypothetical protein
MGIEAEWGAAVLLGIAAGVALAIGLALPVSRQRARPSAAH